MLYTRKGDDGTSSLFGSKDRLPKTSNVFEALGTVDELNSLLGVCFAKAGSPSHSFSMPPVIRAVQQDLFVVQAELAGAAKTLTQSHVDALETAIAQIEALIESPNSFVISGATELSATLDFARSVSRRAERRVIAASKERTLSPETRKYLNRLSSLLYALARYAAQSSSVKEQRPSY